MESPGSLGEGPPLIHHPTAQKVVSNSHRLVLVCIFSFFFFFFFGGGGGRGKAMIQAQNPKLQNPSGVGVRV